MDLIDRCANEAIVVEERRIRELEDVEALGVLKDVPTEGLLLNLSPST
jgi:hypothetical protein